MSVHNLHPFLPKIPHNITVDQLHWFEKFGYFLYHDDPRDYKPEWEEVEHTIRLADGSNHKVTLKQKMWINSGQKDNSSWHFIKHDADHTETLTRYRNYVADMKRLFKLIEEQYMKGDDFSMVKGRKYLDYHFEAQDRREYTSEMFKFIMMSLGLKVRYLDGVTLYARNTLKRPSKNKGEDTVDVTVKKRPKNEKSG